MSSFGPFITQFLTLIPPSKGQTTIVFTTLQQLSVEGAAERGLAGAGIHKI
jgi:hypothetical protein